MDGALSRQLLCRVDLTRTPDYNRCSFRYSPGSPPSLMKRGMSTHRGISFYFHAVYVTQILQSDWISASGLDTGQREGQRCRGGGGGGGGGGGWVSDMAPRLHNIHMTNNIPITRVLLLLLSHTPKKMQM